MSDSTSEMTAPGLDSPGSTPQLAALKDGLPPARRALAEDLRALFGVLGVRVRRYAARRHLDPSSVTRYLNGERVPPWDFVAALIADVREASAPLTAEAEAALRETHRTALKANRRASAMQSLQDELAQADEEARRIRTRERALEERLYDRERSLLESMNRCRKLELRLDTEQAAHRADLALWEDEWEQLRGECGTLSEEVLFLRESLAVTRAELIAAEQECHRLEGELEAMATLEGSGEGPPSLIAALEAADRTTSVAELVAVVTDLEARTQKAMARELVSSASRSRRVEEVAALIAGLQEAGLHAHAETALPALVMTRPPAESAALAGKLHDAGSEDSVATILRSSVELHSPGDVIGLALTLHRGGHTTLAQGLLEAAFVARSVTDVVAMAVWAVDTETEPLTLAALEPAAARRGPRGVVELSIALGNAGRGRHAEAVQVAAGQRRAEDAVQVIDCFESKGMTWSADRVFEAAQQQSTAHVQAFLRALIQGRHSARASEVVDRAVKQWTSEGLAAMISDLCREEHYSQASQALTGVARRGPGPLKELFLALDGMSPGAEVLVDMAVATSSPKRAVSLLMSLEESGLESLAEAVFQGTLTQRPSGHANVFLRTLARSGAAVCQERALYERALAAQVPDVALLLLTFAVGCPPRLSDAVVHGSISGGPVAKVVMLVKQLRAIDYPTRPRADVVIGNIHTYVVHSWPMDKLVSLVMALAESGLTENAENLRQRASTRENFLSALKHEQTKHEQRVFSRAFWRKRPGIPATASDTGKTGEPKP
jgi:hypothetical protein